MMQNEQNKYFLSLVRSALLGEKPQSAPQGVDFNSLLMLARSQSLVELISYAIPKIEPKIAPEIIAGFERLKRTGIAKEINQDIELALLCDTLEREKIDYILLKGSVLKHLYPTPDMRSMCDIDILIREDSVNQADSVMESLGYGDKKVSDHDISYVKPPYVNVELHNSLTQYDFGKKAYEYFKDIWSLARKKGDTCAYELSCEDFYLYHIDHMSKHYATGGCGVRPFCDIFVYLKAHPSMDLDYVNEGLDKIGLRAFESHARALALKWLGDGTGDEISEAMESFILSGGSFGTKERGELSFALRKGTKNKKVSKARLLLYKLFLPYRHMKVVYPSLKKVPFLLPFYWIHRVFRTLFFRRDKIKSTLGVENKQEQIASLGEHFASVGLTEF